MNKAGMLIQKELIYLSTSLKRLVIMAVLFAFLFPMGNITLALAIPSMVVYLLTYGVFAYEEKNKMHLLNASLPVNRRELCVSKYLTGIIYALASCLFTLFGIIAGTKFFGANGGAYTLSFITNIFCVILAMALIYNSIILPLIIYFGAIQVKYVLFVLYFLSFAAVGVLGSGNKIHYMQSVLQSSLTSTSSLMILLSGIILYVISYIISVNLYARKEFK